MRGPLLELYGEPPRGGGGEGARDSTGQISQSSRASSDVERLAACDVSTRGSNG